MERFDLAGGITCSSTGVDGALDDPVQALKTFRAGPVRDPGLGQSGGGDRPRQACLVGEPGRLGRRPGRIGVIADHHQPLRLDQG